jgi:hypothetical protein
MNFGEMGQGFELGVGLRSLLLHSQPSIIGFKILKIKPHLAILGAKNLVKKTCLRTAFLKYCAKDCSFVYPTETAIKLCQPPF